VRRAFCSRRHPLSCGAAFGGLFLSLSTRVLGALCALAVFTSTAIPAFAEEPARDEPVRLRPSSRGARHEEARLEPVTVPPVVETPAPAPPTPTRGDQISQLAIERVGAAYTWGGTSPQTGFDCSGLVRWVLAQLGIEVGRTVWSQYPHGEPVSADDLRPGDIVFFANTYTAGLSHVGIYVGDGQFVDAGTERTGVRRASIWDPYWSARYVGAKRVG
jgi:cell wall-associated NlpC family hydrolase